MRRVLLQVVLPIFFGLEFAYEAMAEAALCKPEYGESIQYTRTPVGERERERGKRETTNLEPLGTVILPASVGFDVGFLRCRVDAVVFQGEHALAHIFYLGGSDGWVEFEEDDVDDWHYEFSKWVVAVCFLVLGGGRVEGSFSFLVRATPFYKNCL